MASVDYGVLANDILKNAGGEGNVAKVVHCATRLRFVLKDATKADKKTIEALPGVITVMEAGGQFQVVIGNNVPKAYAALPKSLTDDAVGETDAPPRRQLPRQGRRHPEHDLHADPRPALRRRHPQGPPHHGEHLRLAGDQLDHLPDPLRRGGYVLPVPADVPRRSPRPGSSASTR